MDPSARRRAGAHYTPARHRSCPRGVRARGSRRRAIRWCAIRPPVGERSCSRRRSPSRPAGWNDRRSCARTCSVCDIDPVAVDVAGAALALWAGEWPDASSIRTSSSPMRCGRRRAAADVRPRRRQPAVPEPARRRDCPRAGRHRRAPCSLRRRREGLRRHRRAVPRRGARCSSTTVDELRSCSPTRRIAARDAAGVRAAILDRGRSGRRCGSPTRRSSLPGFGSGRPSSKEDRCDDRSRTGGAVRRRAGPAFVPVDDLRRPGSRPTRGRRSSPTSPAFPLSSCAAQARSATSRPPPRASAISTTASWVRSANTASRRTTHHRELRASSTSGLIEPLAVAWGRASVRFAGRRWQRPVVQLDAVDPSIARWVQSQLVPKLVIATQTRVLEVAVDDDGCFVPSTPVIAVHAPPERLWHLAAALGAPPITALAFARVGRHGAVGRRGEAVGAASARVAAAGRRRCVGRGRRPRPARARDRRRGRASRCARRVRRGRVRGVRRRFERAARVVARSCAGERGDVTRVNLAAEWWRDSAAAVAPCSPTSRAARHCRVRQPGTDNQGARPLRRGCGPGRAHRRRSRPAAPIRRVNELVLGREDDA